MFLLLPFSYVFLCLLCTLMLSKSYAIGFWVLFALNLLCTPFLIFIVSIFFPKHPKAYCMLPLDTFRVGESYPYKLRNTKGSKRVIILHNGTFEVSTTTFNRHFSVVVNDQKEISSSRFKGVI